jgi:hypothetical protein
MVCVTATGVDNSCSLQVDQYVVRFFSIGEHQTLPNDFAVSSPPLAIECNKHVVAIVTT